LFTKIPIRFHLHEVIRIIYRVVALKNAANWLSLVPSAKQSPLTVKGKPVPDAKVCVNLQFSVSTEDTNTAVLHCVSNKKVSCRREIVRRFVSLNILLSNSRSLKVIRNDTVE